MARSGNKLVNVIMNFLLIAAMLYGIFGVWDTWNTYKAAVIDIEMMSYKPTDTGEDIANPTLDELQKINQDVYAWITVDNTDIDYPVVQGTSNLTYLNRGVDQSFSLSGSIFMDYRNTNDFSDCYTVIYGHHIDEEEMFGELPLFVEEAYFNSHPTGVVYTPEHTYDIQWFACVESDIYDSQLCNPTNYNGTDTMTQLLAYIEKSATVYRDVDVSENDRLVALSTCSTGVADGRIILIGRICPEEQD